MVTTWPVLTEAVHLISRWLDVDAATALMDEVADGDVAVWDLTAAARTSVPRLMRRYADLPMDLAMEWLPRSSMPRTPFSEKGPSPFFSINMLLSQLQPVLASLAPYLLKRTRLYPPIVGPGQIYSRVRL